MGKHTLFMLNPWMEGEEGPYYCPDCGVVEGFLYYTPEIREKIEIISVEFARPRDEIVGMIGLENQSSPVLVLDDVADPPEYAQHSMSTGKWFINDALALCNFLAESYGGVKPHP